MLEALDDVAAEWLGDNEEMGTANELQTPGVEYPTRGDGTEVSGQQLMVPVRIQR